MKWFMPPTWALRSHRQAAMHEPSVVMISMSSSSTKYSPGSTLTASFWNCVSYQKNEASPGLRWTALSCSSLGELALPVWRRGSVGIDMTARLNLKRARRQ